MTVAGPGRGSETHEDRVRRTQGFFATRARGWEDRFPEDPPRYERAVGELAPGPGDVVLDVGCGTGRAFPPLRRAVGDLGLVVGVDVTAEMLAEARRLGRSGLGPLVRADGFRLPFADAVFDAVFAAGFLPHTKDPDTGLRELARVTRPGGRLALFHPVSRAALAARHGRKISDDDTVAPARLRRVFTVTGWGPIRFDDGPDRYLALALRNSVEDPPR